MNKNPKREAIITDFTAVMYAKGYRGKFVLRQRQGGRAEAGRHLGECLEKFMAQRDAGEAKEPYFELETDVENHINCLFRVELDDVKGFLINGLTVKDNQSKRTENYQGFFSNRQVPVAAHLSGLFPKPKPWERFWRPKFRP